MESAWVVHLLNEQTAPGELGAVVQGIKSAGVWVTQDPSKHLPGWEEERDGLLSMEEAERHRGITEVILLEKLILKYILIQNSLIFCSTAYQMFMQIRKKKGLC